MLELKRGGRNRVQTEMVEFIALPFQSSKNFIFVWSFHVVVVQSCRDSKEMHKKKRDAGTELLFCKSKPIAF